MTYSQDPQAKAAERGGDVRVGVYVRRSTDDEHQPYSIEAQDTRLAAYIGSQPGWRQAARFADDASGATTSRPGLLRALAAARAGVIDVLLVYRVDRLTRSLRDLVTLLDDLDQAGVVFRSATEPFDTATPMGRMLVQMLGMFAQFERDTIIDRVIAGMERKAAAGKWKGGRRPFGYQVDPATSTLVVDESEAAVVRLVFGLYTRERLGGKTVARTLNNRGHRTTTGGPWSAHQVARLLANRIYLGELAFRGVTATQSHPPIVSEATFTQAQLIRAARGEDHSKRAANASDYLLTGLMRCPSCGKAMIGTRAHGRSRVYRYYTCFTRVRYDSQRCSASRLDADIVERAVIAALASFYRDQHDLIAEAISAAQASHAAAQDERRSRPLLGSVRERHPRPRGPRQPTRSAQRPVSTTAGPPRRTRRPDRRSPLRAACCRAAADRRPHRRHRRFRQPRPAQGADRGTHRPDQDHRPGSDSPGLPHTPAAGGRPAKSFGPPVDHGRRDRRSSGSCNDQFGGASGARTRNPRIKSPLLYH